VSINAVASFVSTCANAYPEYDPRGSGAIIAGHATACRKRNGQWNNVPQHWRGWCTGNVTNCNGWITCDSYCN
jgi:hypothetical protein